MSRAKSSSISMSKNEQILGFVYLLFEILVLPSLLYYLNSLLPTPLSDGRLNFLYFSLNFIAVCFLFRSFIQRSFTRIKTDFGTFLLITVGGFGVYYVTNLLMNMLINLVVPNFANLNDHSIVQLIGNDQISMIIGTILLAPVAEELLHRGLVFGTLRPKSLWAAYLVSTILFSIVHIMGYIGVYSLPHLLVAFMQYLPAGLILAWTYHKSGNIFSPILIHIAVNTSAILTLR